MNPEHNPDVRFETGVVVHWLVKPSVRSRQQRAGAAPPAFCRAQCCKEYICQNTTQMCVLKVEWLWRERARVSERERVCVRERECVCVRESVCECEREREGESKAASAMRSVASCALGPRPQHSVARSAADRLFVSLVPQFFHFEPSLGAISLRPDVISSMPILSSPILNTRGLLNTRDVPISWS